MTGKTYAIIPYAIEDNVWQSSQDLFMKSAAVRNLVEQGKVKAVGAIYDVGTGKVSWLPSSRVDEILKKVKFSPDKAKEPFGRMMYPSTRRGPFPPLLRL